MRVHDSQAYRKMDVTRERISRILELKEILLSFQTGLKKSLSKRSTGRHNVIRCRTADWVEALGQNGRTGDHVTRS